MVHDEVSGRVVVVVDREKFMVACPAPTGDASGHRWTFIKGVGDIPLPLPFAYRGKP